MHKTAMRRSSLPPYKDYKSALVITLQKDAAQLQEIETIRREYDKRFQRWMPHITMAFPFCPKDSADMSDGGRLHTILGEITAVHEPISCTFDRFEHFTHGKRNYTLYLAPDEESTTLLKDMVARMADAMPDYDDVCRDGIFTPHLSLGQFRSEQKMNEVKAEHDALVTKHAKQFAIQGISWVTRRNYHDRMKLERFYPFRDGA